MRLRIIGATCLGATCRAVTYLGAALAFSTTATALEFGSSARASIMYDTPATSAGKLAVISAGYPLEKVITTTGWVKVRDETGALAWIEESAFSAKRTLLINTPLAHVLEKPLDNAPTRFRVPRGVTLELIAPVEGGWVKVRHASGQEGYARIRDVWGL